MSNYVELQVDEIELDISNPRIARGIAHFGEITSDLMALLLGSTSESCASLRESIRENHGIVHPIVVNKKSDGTYVVIEGNTRLQIYKDFIKNGEPGDWTKIKAIVYEDRWHPCQTQPG
nr:ParB N-terminal domain-containing protein [Schwartzia sp. (in: firmicutes)]